MRCSLEQKSFVELFRFFSRETKKCGRPARDIVSVVIKMTMLTQPIYGNFLT